MSLSRISKVIILVLVLAPILAGCAKDESHWGQNLDPDSKWWKKEGQSWDRKTGIFMSVGYSNPDWTDKYDMRKSADLNARSQVASFMNSLVQNYMEEIRSRNYSISESLAEESAKETITGSVIVARHYDKRGKYKGYKSLIKVDLTNFFAKIDQDYADQMAGRLRKKMRRLKSDELDELIKERTDEAMKVLKESEDPAVEKTLEEKKTEE
jgi:hypothetical protein